MRRIITIGREFGSGGRELGKRLADELNIPCDDKEIINMIALNEELHPNFVDSVTDTDIQRFYPSTIGRRFYPLHTKDHPVYKVINAQTELLHHISEAEDCLIIGRCAEVILQEFHPLKLFVYADMETKIQRCRNRMSPGEQKSDKELIRDIRAIDRQRRALRNSMADTDWGDKTT